MNLEQNNLCPFCFHEIDQWEQNYWCPHCNEAIMKDSGKPTPEVCPKCGKRAYSGWKITYSCPNCKSIKPDEIEDCEEIFPIAVVGPTRSGKTHFLTVLAHELTNKGIWENDYWTAIRVIRREVVSDMGVQAIKQTDEYVNFDEVLYNFNNPGGDDGTLQGTRKDVKTCSLLIELTYKGQILNLFKRPFRKRKIMLALSDTAGEGFKQDNWDNVGQYPIFQNGHAKAVIAMIDPLELTNYSNEALARRNEYVDYGILPEDTNSMPTITASEVLSIPVLKKLMQDKPVAWCLTKTDALISLGKIHPAAMVAQSQGGLTGDDGTRSTSGKINIEELDNVSQQVKDKIILQNSARDTFPDYKYSCYFAVDALGGAFKQGRVMSKPSPRRILDPLLWILWNYGLCDQR